MGKIYICILALYVIFLNSTAAQRLPQNQVMEANNEVVLTLLGTARDFTYRSAKMAGRYDKENNQFLFTIPVQTLYSLNDPEDLTVLNELLISNRADHNISINARFNDNLINVRNYKSPTEVTLEGTVTVYDRNYNVPVRMSLYFNDEVLFYKLNLELDYYGANWFIPAHQRNFLTGIFQVQVVDGKWRNFYNQ